MTPFDVLNTIRQAGGRVFVEDGEIRVITKPGTLTPEAVIVLRENKAALLSILPDAEREAVKWVESLPQAEATAVIAAATQGWAEIVQTEPLVFVVDADDAMVQTMAAAMGVPDPEYDLAAWAGQQLGHVSTQYPTPADQNAYTEVEPAAVVSCSLCGSLALWIDAKGGTHCQHCDRAGLERSQELAYQAAQLRRGLTFDVKGKAAKPTPAPWPPKHLQLPDTIAGIERGRDQQKQLPMDTAKQAQVARLMVPDRKAARPKHFVPAGGW